MDTIEVGTLQKLLPWTEISQLAQVSGVGTYERSFDFAAEAGGNATADGLALRLSAPSAIRSARGSMSASCRHLLLQTPFLISLSTSSTEGTTCRSW